MRGRNMMIRAFVRHRSGTERCRKVFGVVFGLVAIPGQGELPWLDARKDD